MKTQVAAIEFGTSKIVTLLAESGGFNRCEIIGSGTVPYDGYQNGDWVTPNRLAQAVHNSINAAEIEARCKIRDIYIGVPCEYIHVATATATIRINGEGGRVSDADIDGVQDMAADILKLEEKGGNIIHRSPAWFSVDGGKRTMMPVGLQGQNLTACVAFITADPMFIDDARELMGTMGIAVNGFLSPSLGEQLLLTGVDERERAGVFINVGYLNTEVSVIEGDAMIYHAVLPMGAGHFTADLAGEMQIPMHEAEQIKRNFVLVRDEFDVIGDPQVVDEAGRKLSFPLDFVTRCMENSVNELCGMIDMTIKDAGEFLAPRSAVYLTGGGLSLMRGGKEYLAEKLGRPVKGLQLKTAKLNSPVYSSAMGLIDLVFDSIERRTPDQDTLPGRLAGGLRGLFAKK